MREQIMGRFVGARVRRVEDRRLLSGRGRYVDDVVVPDMAHAAFVRSPWPHALIRGIDTTRAAAVPGVYAIFTGPDIAAITNPLMGMLVLPGLYDPWHWALAVDRVRLVGDPVAIVVATSRAVAEDAAEMVDVEYEELEGSRRWRTPTTPAGRRSGRRPTATSSTRRRSRSATSMRRSPGRTE